MHTCLHNSSLQEKWRENLARSFCLQNFFFVCFLGQFLNYLRRSDSASAFKLFFFSLSDGDGIEEEKWQAAAEEEDVVRGDCNVLFSFSHYPSWVYMSTPKGLAPETVKNNGPT